MVPKGNPAGIRSLSDLGKPDVKLAVPNPKFEGIVEQIKTSLNLAGVYCEGGSEGLFNPVNFLPLS